MTLGQSGMSLYHLNNNTFQGNNFNASYIPEGKIFVGLPALSGISLDINSRISYSSLVNTNENGSKVYDFAGIADASKSKNFISLESELSTFYLGFKPNNHSAITFFIRERVGARLFYTDDVMNFAAYGNKSFVGETIDIGSSLVDARYYREYGVGFWKSIPKQNINFGVRFKVLNGMVSVISDRKLDASISIDDDYNHDFSLSNGIVNTSGLNAIEGDNATSHLISNGNLGAGIDLGVNWKINREISAAVAINDLGFIRWKVDPENYAFTDVSFRFEGVDLRDISNFRDAITDSLYNRLVDTTYSQAYTSALNTSVFGSVMYNLSSTDMVTASVGSYIVQDKFRTQYAIGYTKKVGRVLAVSANAIRTPQQSFDFGLGTSITLGALQLYLASDKLIRIWNVPETSSIDLRFGVNLIFGREKGTEKDDRKDLVHPSAYSKKQRIEKSDGIYWIIRKRKPRPIYNDNPTFSNK